MVRRGQSSVEFLVILGAALVVFLFLVSIVTRQLSEIEGQRLRSEAKASVMTLAQAAEDVYAQGPGARKRVFVNIPRGYDASKSSIGNRTVLLNVDNTDIFESTSVTIQGTLPSSAGGYYVWIVAKEGYVLIGSQALQVSPASIYVNKFTSNTTQTANASLNFSNVNSGTITVDLTLSWTNGTVNVTFNDSTSTTKSFSVANGAYQMVGFNFTIGSSALGAYSGNLRANASNGDAIDIPISVEVSQQACASATTCPSVASGAGCDPPRYFVITAYLESAGTNEKLVFDRSESVNISASGWDANANLTLDVKLGGSSVSGYPQTVAANGSGDAYHIFDPLGRSAGTYNATYNDSSQTQSTTFTVTACT